MLKRVNLLVAAFIASTIGSGALAQDVVRVGMSATPYPPFVIYQSSGERAGFEVDILNAVCEEAKVSCEISGFDWAGPMPALSGNKIDMIFNSMSVTDERKKTIAFSRPYYKTAAMFVGEKGTSFDISPEGLKGKNIGVTASSIHANYLKKLYPESTIRYYNVYTELNADLSAGRLDLSLGDALQVEEYLASPEGQNFESKGVAADDPTLGEGVGAGFRQEDTALREKIDAAIGALTASPKYDEIQKKYFSVPVKP